MTIHTQTITTDQALQLLADYRRRKVLHIVRDQNGRTVSVEALAAEFTESAPSSNDGFATHTDCSQIDLVHNHLPKLAEYDIIDWDRKRRTVTDGPAFDTVESMLTLLESHTTELPTGYLAE